MGLVMSYRKEAEMKEPHELSNWDYFKLGLKPVAKGLGVLFGALWGIYACVCALAAGAHFLKPFPTHPSENLPLYSWASTSGAVIWLLAALAFIWAEGKSRADKAD